MEEYDRGFSVHKFGSYMFNLHIYKVTAIKVGHTRFLPILANREVDFGAIFMKIGTYIYFGYIKKWF